MDQIAHVHVVGGVVSAMASFALWFAVLSHNLFAGPALASFFYGVTAYAVYRCEHADVATPQLLFDLVVAPIAAQWTGSLVGAAYVHAFQTPRFVDLRMFRVFPLERRTLGGALRDCRTSDAVRSIPWSTDTRLGVWPLIAAAAAVLVAVYFYERRFSTTADSCAGDVALSSASQTAAAITLTVVAVFALVVYVVDDVLAPSRPRERRLEARAARAIRAKYMLWLALGLALPAVYDFLALPSNFHRYGVQVTLFAVLLALVWLTGRDRVFDAAPRAYSAAALVVLWLVYATLYLAAPLVDDGVTLVARRGADNGDTAGSGHALLWLLVTAAAWFIALPVFGCAIRRLMFLDGDLASAVQRRVASMRFDKPLCEQDAATTTTTTTTTRPSSSKKDQSKQRLVNSPARFDYSLNKVA